MGYGCRKKEMQERIKIKSVIHVYSIHCGSYKRNDINILPCNQGVSSLSATVLQLVYPTMYQVVKEKQQRDGSNLLRLTVCKSLIT